ncbi:10888_t:CDS:2, partial [Acaulospora colombiana]
DKWLFSSGQGEKVLHLGDKNQVLIAWQCSTGDQLFRRLLHRSETLVEVHFSPDSNAILCSGWRLSGQQFIGLISSFNGNELWRIPQIGHLNIQYLPSLNEITVLTRGSIKTIDPLDGSLIATTTLRGAKISHRVAFIYFNRNTMTLHPFQLGGPAALDSDDPTKIRKIWLSPDGNYLLTINTSNEVNLWNTTTGLQKTIIDGFYDWDIKFSKDSSTAIM